MSQYVTEQCPVSTREGIVEALADLGFPREAIEVHEQAQALYGYKGDARSQRAHVIVRRADVRKYMGVGCPNDIGFEQTGQGWREHVSAYDQGWWTRRDRNGQSNRERFAQAGAIGELMAQARRIGARVQKIETTDKDGRRVVRLKTADPLTASKTARRVMVR